jgi:hypothetical protein
MQIEAELTIKCDELIKYPVFTPDFERILFLFSTISLSSDNPPRNSDIHAQVHNNGQDYVSELRPPTGLLFIPQVIHMCVESHGGMVLTGEARRTRRENCPSATLSIKNPT